MSLPVPANKADWHAFILGLFLAFSAISLLELSALTLLFTASSMNGPNRSMLLTLLLLAGGLFFSALLLIPGAYLNGRKFFGLPDIRIPFPPINEAALFMTLAALWVLSLVLGQSILSNPLAAILLPILNILAIGLPVILFLRIALRELALPPAQYGWSAFGVTLVIGPIAGILLEGIVFAILLFIVGIYAGYNHELTDQIAQLARIAQNSHNPDLLVAAAAPILFSPVGILTILGLFSVAVPAIEEAIKVTALWLFADKIQDPIQGFVLGVLSGAAFALAENLGFSSTGASDWLATAALRASSALPHMLNSGILGWALVSAWKKHAYLRLSVAYIAVMLIHGTWNAISLALWLNALLPYVQHAPSFVESPIPFFSGWVVMIFGTLAGLMYCNRVLRLSLPSRVEYNEPLSSSNTGEHDGDSENAD